MSKRKFCATSEPRQPPPAPAQPRLSGCSDGRDTTTSPDLLLDDEPLRKRPRGAPPAAGPHGTPGDDDTADASCVSPPLLPSAPGVGEAGPRSDLQDTAASPDRSPSHTVSVMLCPVRFPDSPAQPHPEDRKKLEFWSKKFLASSKDVLLRQPHVVEAVRQELHCSVRGRRVNFPQPDVVTRYMISRSHLVGVPDYTRPLLSLRGRYADALTSAETPHTATLDDTHHHPDLGHRVASSIATFAQTVARSLGAAGSLMAQAWGRTSRILSPADGFSPDCDYINMKALRGKAERAKLLLAKISEDGMPGRDGIFKGLLLPEEMDTILTRSGAVCAAEKEAVVMHLMIQHSVDPIPLPEGGWGARIGGPLPTHGVAQEARGGGWLGGLLHSDAAAGDGLAQQRREAVGRVSVLLSEKKLLRRVSEIRAKVQRATAEKGYLAHPAKKQRALLYVKELKHTESLLDNVRECKTKLEDARTHSAVIEAYHATSQHLRYELDQAGGREAVEAESERTRELVSEVSALGNALSAPLSSDIPGDDAVMEEMRRLEADLGIAPDPPVAGRVRGAGAAAAVGGEVAQAQAQAPQRPAGAAAGGVRARYSVREGRFVSGGAPVASQAQRSAEPEADASPQLAPA